MTIIGEERIERARESWNRVLNMDGGQPQATAAGLWASLYAEELLKRVSTSPEAVTDEMIKAGVKAMQLNYGTREYPPPGTVEAIYEAMRVAALSKVTVV